MAIKGLPDMIVEIRVPDDENLLLNASRKFDFCYRGLVITFTNNIVI